MTARILLVDDDATALDNNAAALEAAGFEVSAAPDASDAIRLNAQQPFDLVICNQHLPGPTDGLAICGAVRLRNPNARTYIFGSFPNLSPHARNLLAMTDLITVRPSDPQQLVEALKTKLAFGPIKAKEFESLATILERSIPVVMEGWYLYLSNSPYVMGVPMTKAVRTAHLPQVLGDIGRRLRANKPYGTHEMISEAAVEHGENRCRQGYRADMLVEEARALQVAIFQTLQYSLSTIDFSILLQGVMTIADEVDSQLSQSMSSFVKTQMQQTKNAQPGPAVLEGQTVTP